MSRPPRAGHARSVVDRCRLDGGGRPDVQPPPGRWPGRAGPGGGARAVKARRQGPRRASPRGGTAWPGRSRGPGAPVLHPDHRAFLDPHDRVVPDDVVLGDAHVPGLAAGGHGRVGLEVVRVHVEGDEAERLERGQPHDVPVVRGQDVGSGHVRAGAAPGVPQSRVRALPEGLQEAGLAEAPEQGIRVAAADEDGVDAGRAPGTDRGPSADARRRSPARAPCAPFRSRRPRRRGRPPSRSRCAARPRGNPAARPWRERDRDGRNCSAGARARDGA